MAACISFFAQIFALFFIFEYNAVFAFLALTKNVTAAVHRTNQIHAQPNVL